MKTEFSRILGEIQEMHDKKQKDYGTNVDPFANVRAAEDLGIKPWIGCLIRMNDKMKRLHKAARGGTMANESVEDSMLDLAVYSIIALVLRREEQSGGTGLQEGTIHLDTGRDSYFTTGKGCSGPYLGRNKADEGGADVGCCCTHPDQVQRKPSFESPSSIESKRIGSLLRGEDVEVGQAHGAWGIEPDRVGFLP